MINTPLHQFRRALIGRLTRYEEQLYEEYQNAYMMDDAAMMERIKDLIEAVVFTRECAAMPERKTVPVSYGDDRDGQGGGTE